jgi:glycine cleavage system H protein
VSTEIESPLSGKIISINHPYWLNESPYEKGWLVKMDISTLSEWEDLMTAIEYENYMSVFYNKI